MQQHGNGNAGPTCDCPAKNPATTDTHVTQRAAAPSSHIGLYVLPALIILVFVVGWLFVSWLVHQDLDPKDLVAGMQQPGRKSWQNAYALSQLLLNPDYDHLTKDVRLCRAVTAVLEQQNQQAQAVAQRNAVEDQELNQFRIFLCRALGQFRIPEALPVLLDCAQGTTSQPPYNDHEWRVRLASIEAIAVHAGRVADRQSLLDSNAVAVLATATHAPVTGNANQHDSDIASAATFALGVIGGPAALEELLELVTDTRIDVRYNAAAGLARHGHSEAIPVLIEMLDPDNAAAAQSEETTSARAWKRQMILSTAIQATSQLTETLSSQQCAPLLQAVRQLSRSETVSARVRLDAKQLVLRMR